MRLGTNKGLAAAAVGALCVTGLTAGLPLDAARAAGPGVVFVSIYNEGHDVSFREDDKGTNITLAAMKLDLSASVFFQYNADPAAGDASPGWTDIGPAPAPVGPYVRMAWTPLPGLVGTAIAIRAVAVNGPTTTYATRQGVFVNAPASSVESVAVTDQTTRGFFDQPYVDSGRTATHVAVSGTTSAAGGTAQLSWWNPATQAFQGKIDAQVEGYSVKVGPGSYVGGGTFTGDLDITAFDADASDVLAVGAELDTDDVVADPLYVQHIGSATAFAPQTPAGQPTIVTVTVADAENGRPVAGAEVRRTAGGTLVGYTDGAGQVHDQATSGALGTYYVNTTDTDGYDAGTDVTTAVSTYPQTLAYAHVVAADGRTFDDDEYAPGDIAIQLTDSTRTPMLTPSPVNYRLYPSGAVPPAFQSANTDAHGRLNVPFTPQGPDGAYVVDFYIGGPGSPVSTFRFTAGDSTLAVTPTAGRSDPGGQLDFRGTLAVAGKPLAGRRVAVTYKRGLELVPGKKADAGIVSGGSRLLSVTVTTDASGAFVFTVDDPAEKPKAAETGGKLSLATLPGAGGTSTGNANETAAATTAFGSKKGKAKIRLSASSAGSKDKLVVKGPGSLAGEKVKFFRLVHGKLELIKAKKLGKRGDTTLKVQDANGGGLTTYVVKLLKSKRAKAAKSKPVELR
jgi:hypothetical protein